MGTQSLDFHPAPQNRNIGGHSSVIYKPCRSNIHEIHKKKHAALYGVEGRDAKGLVLQSSSPSAETTSVHHHTHLLFLSPFNFTSKLVIKLKNTKNLKGPLDSDAKH